MVKHVAYDTYKKGSEEEMSHEEFIKLVKDAIYDECTDARIVPSILIAHAALLSDWGRSELAIKANNLYKTAASSIFSKKSVYEQTSYSETSSGKLIPLRTSYRVYDSWYDSVTDYIARILNKEKYLAMTECKTLEESLHCYVELTDKETPHLESRIMSFITMYRLDQYDYIRSRHNPFNLAQIGDRGEIVRWLQYELSVRGYKISASFIGDFFDYPTMIAVRDYQKDHGLDPHGILDLKTLKTLVAKES